MAHNKLTIATGIALKIKSEVINMYYDMTRTCIDNFVWYSKRQN